MKNSQLLLCVVLGVTFWLAGVLIIRLSGAAVFTEGNTNLVLMYALAIPLTGFFMFITKRLGRLRSVDMVHPVSIITLTAAILDAVALTWFRHLYSDSFEVALHGAAFILWGVGLGLLFAYVLESRGKFV